MKPVSEEIAVLRTLAVPELVTRYLAVFGKPPRVKHREWLWRRIAWKIQEQRFGGLSVVAKRRLDELICELEIPLAGVRRAKRPSPSLGTTVARVWKNREIRATSVEGGWEHEGVVYGSLTAIAEHVTGSHWNGRAFFGLAKRRAK
jgi:hypothetical protein